MAARLDNLRRLACVVLAFNFLRLLLLLLTVVEAVGGAGAEGGLELVEARGELFAVGDDADGPGKLLGCGLEAEDGGADDVAQLAVEELGHGGLVAGDVLE